MRNSRPFTIPGPPGGGINRLTELIERGDWPVPVTSFLACQ